MPLNTKSYLISALTVCNRTFLLPVGWRIEFFCGFTSTLMLHFVLYCFYKKMKKKTFLRFWWQDATLFVYFHIFITYIHSFNHNTFIRRHSLKPLTISSSLCQLSGENLPVVPSRESNSGLPYSKPTCCQLSHAAP
jgi:hypothetical protein